MMKKAMVMPIVFVVILLISLLIGTYMQVNAVNMSKEFNKDLAEVRGYWGAYGAKELNVSGVVLSYKYQYYDINASLNSNICDWNLSIPSGKNSGVHNKDIYTRKLMVDNNISKIISYRKN